MPQEVDRYDAGLGKRSRRLPDPGILREDLGSVMKGVADLDSAVERCFGCLPDGLRVVFGFGDRPEKVGGNDVAAVVEHFRTGPTKNGQ